MKAVVDMVFGPDAPGTDGMAPDNAALGAEHAGAGAIASMPPAALCHQWCNSRHARQRDSAQAWSKHSIDQCASGSAAGYDTWAQKITYKLCPRLLATTALRRGP